MKRLLGGILVTIMSLFLSMSVSLPVAAVNVNVLNTVCSSSTTNNPSGSAVCRDNNPGGSNPVIKVIQVVVQIIILIIGIASVITIIIQGLRIVTSNGDSQTVASARNGIIYAVIGIAVAAISQLIVSFVLTKFTG